MPPLRPVPTMTVRSWLGVRQSIGLHIRMDIELGVGLDIGLDIGLVGIGENLEENLEADLRENEVDLRWPRGEP